MAGNPRAKRNKLEVQTSAPRNLTSQPYHKNITIEEIVHLIEVEGLNITQTAKRLGCDKSNISDHLRRNNITPGYLQNFKQNRANYLALKQAEILKSISCEDIKKASLVQKTKALGTLYDKERMERGQSTMNIAHAITIERQAELEQLAALAGQKRITEACEIPEAEVMPEGTSEYVLE